jgi:dephospho-CoA kinase
MNDLATNHRFILGIAGKPASGKSEVLSVLGDVGWRPIDADKIVHDLYREGEPGCRKIVDFFGEDYLSENGDVDRVKLRGLVFDDLRKLKILNNLIHPLVHSEILAQIQAVSGENVAIEAIHFDPAVFEEILDGVLYVEREEAALREVLEGRGLSDRQIDGVLGAFVEPFAKDLVIENNSSLEELEKKVIISIDKLIS